MRRLFQLPEEDEACLAACNRGWEAITDGGVKWLIFPDFLIPEGYNHQSVTAALRIPPSYPDDQIDMVLFLPPPGVEERPCHCGALRFPTRRQNLSAVVASQDHQQPLAFGAGQRLHASSAGEELA